MIYTHCIKKPVELYGPQLKSKTGFDFLKKFLTRGKTKPSSLYRCWPIIESAAVLAATIWVKLICLYRFHYPSRTPVKTSLRIGKDKGKFLAKFRRGTGQGAVSDRI